MNQPMKEEERQRARDGALVYRGQKTLQFGQRDSLVSPHHFAKNEQTYGRRLDVAQREFMNEKRFVGHGR